MNKLKILFTAQSYYPDICGISNVVTNLAEKMAEKGHEITVVTENRDRKFIERNNVKIIEFSVQGNPITGYSGEVEKYINYIRSYEGDIIINECTQIWATDLLQPYLDEIKQIKILHSHGYSWLTLKPRNPYYRFLCWDYYRKLKNYLLKYDHVFYLTDCIEDKAYGDKNNVTHYSILPNGVDAIFFDVPDLELVNNLTNISLIDNEKPLVINVSNFSLIKNQEFVLQSIYKCKSNFSSLFIGSEENGYSLYLKKIKGILDKKYGYRDVSFVSGLSRNEIRAILHRADLFLHGGIWEAFPVVLCEAIVTSTPFISTNVGNARTLKGGKVVNSIHEMSVLTDKFFTDIYFRNTMVDECGHTSCQYSYIEIVLTLESCLYDLLNKQMALGRSL